MVELSDKTYTIVEDFKSYRATDVERLYENSVLSLLSESPNDLPKRNQLQDLQECKEKLEKELNEAETVLAGSSASLSKLIEEYEGLKKKTETLTNEDQVISRKKADLENEYALFLKTKCNTHDSELLEKMKLQYKLVRNMTQVRFLFALSNSDNLEGHVFNSVTRKVFNFSINTAKLNSEQVQEHLMKLMKDASHPGFADVPWE